jgi:hypothetical protein
VVKLLLFLFLALPVSAAAAAAAADSIPLKYTMGFDYSSGDYGLESDTEIYFVPFGVEADFYPFLVKVTLPFILIDGPTGDGSKTTGGIGRLSGRVSYFIPPFHEAAPWFEVFVELAAPTETIKSLGSGWSFSLRADAIKQYGRLTPFASLGRTFYTDDLFHDRMFTSIGFSYRFSKRLSGGLLFDWFEASADRSNDSKDLVVFASVKTGGWWSVGPYASKGFGEGSPDFGIGVLFSFRPPND